jgi:hypothetical protein
MRSIMQLTAKLTRKRVKTALSKGKMVSFLMLIHEQEQKVQADEVSSYVFLLLYLLEVSCCCE